MFTLTQPWECSCGGKGQVKVEFKVDVTMEPDKKEPAPLRCLVCYATIDKSNASRWTCNCSHGPIISKENW